MQNKNAITKASDDNVIDVDKIISKQIDIDNNSIKSITIKPIKKEKQVEVKNADSLYIIW